MSGQGPCGHYNPGHAGAAGGGREPEGVIRRRVIALGLPLSLLAFWLVVRMEQKDLTGLPTGLALYYHVVAILLLLTVGNAGMRRAAPRSALTRAELLCLFSMMSAASVLACWEMLGTILPALAYPVRWANGAAPDRAALGQEILYRLPPPALPRDPEAARQLFSGRRPGEADLLLAWAGPFLFWGALLLLTLVMAHAAARLLYPRWKEEEKLGFPLVSLPLAVTDEDAGLWRNRLFWLGFSLTLAVDLLNGLAALYPGVPSINTKVVWLNTDPVDPAWIAFSHVPLTFHPIVLGLAFFLPVDLLFSCWFFFLLARTERYLVGAYNLYEGSLYQFGGNQPGINEQNAGAILVLALVAVRSALRGAGPLPRREAAILAAGTALWALALRYLGVPWLLALLFLLGAAAMAVLVCRLRAEMGLPVHNLQFLSPELALGVLLGPSLLSREALTGLMALHPLLRSQQGNPMPHLLEARFLADRTGARRFTGAVLLAAIAAALVGPWIFLTTLNRFGLENTPGGFHAFMTDGWDQLHQWLSRPGPPDTRALAFCFVGALATLGLTALRHAWPGSPLHPLGFALCGSWGLMIVVTPLFLAWAIKAPLLRYGGLSAYRRAIPLAHGLVLGEFVAGTFWTILAVLLDQPTYRIWLF